MSKDSGAEASTAALEEDSKEVEVEVEVLVKGRKGKRRASFTLGQLQEMERQALIYKYMVTGVAVPIHLILPIWKSVASSPIGPHRYPSLIGLGNLCLDFWNNTEPEPGRCRRTDGKKWRCSRDVIPDQKYCERHMHRGRIKKPQIAAAAADQAPPPENTTITDNNAQTSASDPAAANVGSAAGASGSGSSSSSDTSR